MRVLLVEDDPTTARSIELMLTHANFNVYCTDMGEEAWSWASSTTTI
jgi:two-component system, cell cycle response regulator CtrA